MTAIDVSIRHALTLLRRHAEAYPKEIVVEPPAWRQRMNELKQDLHWLEFVRDYPLPPERPAPNMPPAPPTFRR